MSKVRGRHAVCRHAVEEAVLQTVEYNTATSMRAVKHALGVISLSVWRAFNEDEI